MQVSALKPLSVTNKSVGSRTAAASNVGAAVVVHVAVREPVLLFVNERGFNFMTDFLAIRSLKT